VYIFVVKKISSNSMMGMKSHNPLQTPTRSTNG